LFFLMFLGNMFYLRARIDSMVTQEAIRYAAEYANPNLAAFEEEIPTTVEGKELTKDLYRYINIFSKEENLDTKLSDRIGETSGYFTGMNPDNIVIKEHRAKNYVIYQSYVVEVAYELKTPIKFLFDDDYLTLDMTARAEVPVTDTAEFIRNVDMAVDLVERTEAGTKLTEKINDTYAKVEEFLNGEGGASDDNGAVAGGATGGTNKVTSAQEYAEKVSDKTKVNGTYANSYTASEILREELYDAGVSNPPYGNAAHHIVPWNDSRAKEARDILDEYGIEYNSAANGVFLPTEKNEYTGNTTMHVGNHSKEYITEITNRIRQAEQDYGTKEAVVKELNSIREDLLNGTLQLNEAKE
ncbi:MAG: AHH domain-containing protein, partial [Lachnospiraceae bacterium]|nr:AHH domain-containing protein [Lachnospiraceae bacterium]